MKQIYLVIDKSGSYPYVFSAASTKKVAELRVKQHVAEMAKLAKNLGHEPMWKEEDYEIKECPLWTSHSIKWLNKMIKEAE